MKRRLAELELDMDRQQGWIRGGSKADVSARILDRPPVSVSRCLHSCCLDWSLLCKWVTSLNIHCKGVWDLAYDSRHVSCYAACSCTSTCPSAARGLHPGCLKGHDNLVNVFNFCVVLIGCDARF